MLSMKTSTVRKTLSICIVIGTILFLGGSSAALYLLHFPPNQYYCNRFWHMAPSGQVNYGSSNYASSESNSDRRHPKGIHCSCTDASHGVLLTFDDGPTEYTPILLDNLSHHNVTAIFFLKGENVDRYPNTTRRILEEGHTICSHTYSHPNLEELEASDQIDKIKNEIELTKEAIQNVTGISVYCFRPPFGRLGHWTAAYLLSQGYSIIFWNSGNTEHLYHNARRSAIDAFQWRSALAGGISVWHDSTQDTCENIGDVIEEAHRRNARFISPQHCFGPTFEF